MSTSRKSRKQLRRRDWQGIFCNSAVASIAPSAFMENSHEETSVREVSRSGEGALGAVEGRDSRGVALGAESREGRMTKMLRREGTWEARGSRAEKTELVSIIVSNKMSNSGHRLRHEALDKLQGSHLHAFGSSVPGLRA